MGMTSFLRDFVLTLQLHTYPHGVHVIGHSMGGALALAFTEAHGAACHVTQLTLIAPAMSTPHHR